jgi:hypothetical protein
MKVRTCPNCDHKYNKLEYLKSFIDTIWANVKCKRCNHSMTIDLSRRIVVVFVFGFWMIILNTTITYLDMNPMLWFMMVCIFLTGGFFIFTFDTFKKVDK